MTAEERRAIEEGLPARIFGKERMLRAASDPKRLNKGFERSFPKAMFVLLPLFALLTTVAWRERTPRYPAHLYAALHLHAAWFAAFTISALAHGFLPERVAALIGFVLVAYAIWYALATFKRVFGESWTRTLLKSVAISLAYFLAIFATTLALLAWFVFTA